MKFLVLAVLALCAPKLSDGHGMVMDPINRGSRWRIDPDAPTNFQDNQQYCGGYWRQWGENGGKCGECGDDYGLERPRPAENTGTYGLGVSGATYKAGDVIDITVRLTANHGGRFIFKLCCLDEKDQLETQECFDENLLELVDGGTAYPLPDRTTTGEYVISVKLPSNVTGDPCVLQWKWITASNWGWCDDEKTHGDLGCGDEQETYQTCSDITIV